ncbi:MAG: sigma-70 family RNA polymerase sigma factor [Erysipelotrichales bacterium]|nr:sigma-70 family RNA polymerase sigma factor [Erysipelotrichales bacterium]
MAKITSRTLKKLKSTSHSVMENAFNAIYDEYSYLVYYVSLKIVKDKDAAKDITNETFLKFFESKNTIKDIKKVKSYLTSISKNLSLNHLKDQERRVSFDEEIIEEQRYDDFENYISKFKEYLDEEEIDLIVYHLLYDFSFKEIALKNNTTTSSVSSKYQRAIIKVRKHFKEI